MFPVNLAFHSLLLVILISDFCMVETGTVSDCVFTSSHKGNYPRFTPMDVEDLFDVSKWTTATFADFGLSNEWDRPNNEGSYEAEFTIRPTAPGFENRMVIHIASDLRSPFKEYQDYPSGNYISLHAKEVIEKVPFNCHISRNIKLNLQTDLMRKNIEECQPDLYPFDCVKTIGLLDKFQCVAGTVSPICCYPRHFFENRNPKTLSQHLLYMKAVHNNTIEDLKTCLDVQREVGLQQVENNCPGDFTNDIQKQLFYIFNKNTTCNPFLATTSKGCSVTKKNIGPYTHPCYGTCLTGMIINVEIPAINTNEDVAEAVVTIVQREVDFSQKYGSSLLKTSERFGYASSDSEESRGKFRVIRKKINGLPIFAGKWNKIWLRWSRRNPACLNEEARRAFLAPILELGVVGLKDPFVTVDFACTNFEEDENDAMGWRFGWLAGDIFVPRMSRVFNAGAYAINSVNGSVFEYSLKAPSGTCTISNTVPLPGPLVAAYMAFIVFIVIVCLFCVSARLQRDAKRQEKYEKYKKY